MKRKPIRFILYLLLLAAVGIVRVLPRKVGLGLAAGIGRLSYFVLPRYGKVARENIRQSYAGELSEKEIRGISRRVFQNLAKTAVDLFLYPRMTKENIRRLVDFGDLPRRMDALLERRQGLILITAHLGHWELFGASLTLLGYQGAVIGRRIYYPPFNEVLVRWRRSKGLETIYRDDPPKRMLSILKKNQIIGILADQDVESIDGIFVPFFGRLAYTPTAPVKLAMASGAPILTAFLIRSGDRYRMLVDEPIEVAGTESREETLQKYTAEWSQLVERRIRQYPEQWVWFHPRWKTRPSESEVDFLQFVPAVEKGAH